MKQSKNLKEAQKLVTEHMRKFRWKDKTPEERKAQAMKMVEGKRAKRLSPVFTKND